MKRILSKEKYIFSKILIIVFLINIHFYYRALKKIITHILGSNT